LQLKNIKNVVQITKSVHYVPKAGVENENPRNGTEISYLIK
jgi:hypothetical protein